MAGTKKAAKPSKPRKPQGVVKRVEENLESRFIAAAQVATATGSPEVNLADALVAAVEGGREPKPKAVPSSKKRRSTGKSRRRG